MPTPISNRSYLTIAQSVRRLRPTHMLSSPEQGKGTLDSPGQQEHSPIILSMDPSAIPVQLFPPQQQQQGHQGRYTTPGLHFRTPAQHNTTYARPLVPNKTTTTTADFDTEYPFRIFARFRSQQGQFRRGCDRVRPDNAPFESNISNRQQQDHQHSTHPRGSNRNRHATFANISVAAAAPYPPTSTRSQLEQR
ncbi:hypothetical protein K457DRAFT_21944 [Linnemannia elongata AG-77]|uniref:Uncharacterized protein n=1 Tax=Linnemannia elongata AG-77 TaxID=1314771 RepID=A0A197JQF4_9FUNG|nr:hypothetical protein K457DRAFT_21944 [Linnemannia elongata AG-77]